MIQGYRFLRHFRCGRVHHQACKAANLRHGRLVDEREVGGRRVFGAKYVRDDLDVLEEVIVYEQRVREHEHGLWQSQAVLERPRRLWLEVLNRVVRDVADRAAGERGHLRYLDVLVDGQFALEGVHRIALDGFVGPDFDHLERIGAYEAVPSDVLARQDGLEQEAVFRVVGDAQIGDDGRDEIGGELDVHGHAITALFMEN